MRKKVCTVIACIAVILLCVIGFAENDEKDTNSKRTVIAAEVKESDKSVLQEEKEEVTEDKNPAKSSDKKAESSQVSNKEVKSSEEAKPSKQESEISTKPSHTHSWEPVYTDVTVYDDINIYGDRCNNCGFSTNTPGSMYAHIDADPFDRCGSYSTGVVIGTEKVARTEKQLTGYKCSCGKSK